MRAVRAWTGTAAGIVAVAVALSGCSGSSGKHPATSTPPTSEAPTPTTASTPAAPAPATAAVNPLTGGKPSKNKVVAVKIDDTANGRPQVGVNKADIVYIEQVEGGLTRLLAVFNSTLPTTVEAVRSTRAGDPELMAQYGPVVYVASGGSHNPLAVLDNSNLNSDINDRGGPGFWRDPSRPAPYNLKANLQTIAKKIKGVKARNIGLTWSAKIPNRPVGNGMQVRTQVGGTPVGFNYDAKTGKYERIINGAVQHTAGGAVIATPNVIVQYCSVTLYAKDRDVLGNPNYYTHTVGKGHVVVFRGGKAILGEWSRPRATDGTKLTDRHGRPIPLAPGGAWFVLVANGTPLNK
jgi:hypothetical protein